MKTATIILAAGKGTRMRSRRPKVLHSLAGRPLIGHVVDTARAAVGGRIIVVVGHGAGEVMAALRPDAGLTFAVQKSQRGTAHAVLSARRALGSFTGTVVILSGDAPLVTKESVGALIFLHRRERADLSVLTAILSAPEGYGRILRGKDGDILGVIEEKDALPEEISIREVNSGVYAADARFLFAALRKVGTRNVQKEYYLPDIIRLARDAGKKVVGLVADDPEEILGINTRADLARAEGIVRDRTLRAHMDSGVTIVDPSSSWIDAGVRIGMDTEIRPHCSLRGQTVIGKGCLLEPGSIVVDSQIGDGSVVKAYSVIEGSRCGPGTTIGPFAHLRPGTVLGKAVKIGNFVEVKKSVLGSGSKANHLTYLGDASLGRDVNVGAGTITCNYDGFRKSRTVIGDRVLIGSDTMLVAPVRVGSGALTGAGSTITKDIPPGALAVARSRQANIAGYRKKIEKKARKHRLPGKTPRSGT